MQGSVNFVYDSLGRLKSANNPESGITQYTLDDNGNVLVEVRAGGITRRQAYYANSLTAQFVEAVKGTQTRICDTRKTAPGLRLLDKYAVRAGGGSNHRFGLFDLVLDSGCLHMVVGDDRADCGRGARRAAAHIQGDFRPDVRRLPRLPRRWRRRTSIPARS